MIERTGEKARLDKHRSGGTEAAHPLDAWLRRELRALYDDARTDELPEGIARLASRLEERLAATGDSARRGGEETEASNRARPADRRNERR